MKTESTIEKTAPGQSQAINAVPGYAPGTKRPRQPKRIETQQELMDRYRRDSTRSRGEEGKIYGGPTPPSPPPEYRGHNNNNNNNQNHSYVLYLY